MTKLEMRWPFIDVGNNVLWLFEMLNGARPTPTPLKHVDENVAKDIYVAFLEVSLARNKYILFCMF